MPGAAVETAAVVVGALSPAPKMPTHMLDVEWATTNSYVVARVVCMDAAHAGLLAAAAVLCERDAMLIVPGDMGNRQFKIGVTNFAPIVYG